MIKMGIYMLHWFSCMFLLQYNELIQESGEELTEARREELELLQFHASCYDLYIKGRDDDMNQLYEERGNATGQGRSISTPIAFWT
jgi:hypothetical protein